MYKEIFSLLPPRSECFFFFPNDNSLFFSHDVQLTLLRGCWVELFALGLAQCSQTLSLSTIITALINHLQASIGQEKYPAVKIQRFTEHIVMLQV